MTKIRTTLLAAMQRRMLSLINPLQTSLESLRADTSRALDESIRHSILLERRIDGLGESVLFSRWLASPDLLANRNEAGHWLNWLGLCGEGVEVGVFRGEYSSEILRTWRGTRLTSVDPWREFPRAEYVDVCNLSQAEHDRNHEIACAALSQFAERSSILRTTSAEAVTQFSSRSLDFVYLDAQHHYEAVRDDIAMWLPKVKRGGVIGGHDYLDGTLASGRYGVKRAADELAREMRATLVVTREPDWPSWYLRVG